MVDIEKINPTRWSIRLRRNYITCVLVFVLELNIDGIECYMRSHTRTVENRTTYATGFLQRSWIKYFSSTWEATFFMIISLFLIDKVGTRSWNLKASTQISSTLVTTVDKKYLHVMINGIFPSTVEKLIEDVLVTVVHTRSNICLSIPIKPLWSTLHNEMHGIPL